MDLGVSLEVSGGEVPEHFHSAPGRWLRANSIVPRSMHGPCCESWLPNIH